MLPEGERRITVDELAKQESPDGRIKRAKRRIRRWCRKGLSVQVWDMPAENGWQPGNFRGRRVKLEHEWSGRTLWTTVEAVDRFKAARNGVKDAQER